MELLAECRGRVVVCGMGRTGIIAITGRKRSSLARHSDVVLWVPVERDGCRLGLAPMVSTTATLVLGDCLAAGLV